MNHTKEPWRVHLLDRRTMIASDVENGYLAETRHIHSGDIEEINAKRIVSCVNACAGITNEALEAGVVRYALINFQESLGLEKEEKFYVYDIPVLEDV